MIGVKNLSLIVTIITGVLLPFSIFKSFTFFIVDLTIFLFSALVCKVSKVVMHEKIIDSEYKSRFGD